MGIAESETGVNNIYLTDNVRAMALSENRYGSGKEFKNFTLFYIGAGLGAEVMMASRQRLCPG